MGNKLLEPFVEWRKKPSDPFVEWRNKDLHAQIRELQRQLSPYCLDEPLRIVVCGDTAAGKSSLINNVISALKERLVQIANVGSRAADSVTKMYTEYEITLKDGTQEKTLIVICDTEGVGQSNTSEQIEALKEALQGKFKPNERMDSTEKRSDGRKKHAVYVILVRDAVSTMNVTAATQGGINLQAIQTYAYEQSIPMSIFLTKCDTLDKKVGRDITKLYKSKKVQQAIHITSQMFRDFNKCRIFPIVNYTEQRKAEPTMILQTLFALQEIVSDVEAYMSSVVGKT